MKRTILQQALCVVMAVTLATTMAVGQTTSATVTGAVLDPSGAAIVAASVALESLQTHVMSTVTTNSAGFYRVSGLLPGFYRATVTKDGFKSVVRDAIELHGQDEVAINYQLQVGSVTESVTVTAEGQLQTESATVSTVIEARQIENTPLNGRNVMNLASLTPGVIPQGATSGSPLGNQAAIGNYTNPAGWGNYQIGGGFSGANTEYVDGGPLNRPVANWIGILPSQDSIQEFRVETNNIISEYGRYYGGVMNFTTKSGTDQFHGTGYEYFRNTVLDANSFFNKAANPQVNRPPVQQNQYGASLGGPLKKDKLFFFSSWENYKNRSGLSYLTTVPTVAETTGDFRADAPVINFLGQQVSCNGGLNTVCPDPTALYMASVFKYWPAPNIVPRANGNNFATNASSGTSSNGVTARGDYNLSSRQQLFARYSWWKTNTLGTNYYHNNVPQPEVLSTSHQAVLGDTITLSPTMVADFRESYLRFNFVSQPPSIGHVDLSKFGPAYGALQSQATFDVLPVPFLVGYGNQFPLLIINVIQYYDYNTYNFAGNITKTVGRSAIRFGGAARRVEAYFSGNTGLGPTGIFLFVGGFPTNNEFANFMEGSFIPNQFGIGTGRETQTVNYNQGYYVNETFHASSRLTLTGGVRWEIPGAVSEKKDLNTVFLPTIASPLGTILNPATGSSQALHGNLALVNSPAYKSRLDDVQHYHLFAPNLGFSLRVLQNTVLRGGYGMSFISLDSQGALSPFNSPINSVTTPPTGTLSNPFPQINGVLPQPVGRDPNFSAAVQVLGVTGRIPGAKYPYVQQWNLNVEQQLPWDSRFQIGYQGSEGTHLEMGLTVNQLGDNFIQQAATQYTSLVNSGSTPTQADAQTFVNQQVANPLAGKLAPGSAYNGATIRQGQLLRPYLQFDGVTNSAANVGTSNYNSLQASFQKRFHSAGTFFAAYTWAKLMGTVDTRTGFLEGNTTGGIQDTNNLAAERSLESFDVPQRLVLNYSVNLPIGIGQKWLGGVGTGLNRVIGGWRFSGITTFQSGYPIALSAQTNDLSTEFGVPGIRPNRVQGCQAKIGGSPVSRLNKAFNTACFVQPSTPFSFGNEGRVDSQLRVDRVNNWDIAIAKDTQVTERVRAIFETEFLNAFNRTQFGPPASQVGSPGFGSINSTLNNPREIQFSLRLAF